MNGTKVSVVIPVRNSEKKLRECLDSVLAQTYHDYEVIVVDNNSTDNTTATIKEYEAKDNRVRYLLERRVCRGAARNRGEKDARGDIVLMIDSDCITPANWIEEMVRPIVRQGKVAVQGVKRPVIRNYWTEHVEKEEKWLTDREATSNKLGFADSANFAIKRSILEEIGYSNPVMSSSHDMELALRLYLTGYEITFSEMTVSHYHPDTGKKIFVKAFQRGIWNGMLRKAYRDKLDRFHIAPPISHFNYFIGIAMEMVTFHKNFGYDFLNGMGWRLGLLVGRCSRPKEPIRRKF